MRNAFALIRVLTFPVWAPFALVGLVLLSWVGDALADARGRINRR